MGSARRQQGRRMRRPYKRPPSARDTDVRVCTGDACVALISPSPRISPGLPLKPILQIRILPPPPRHRRGRRIRQRKERPPAFGLPDMHPLMGAPPVEGWLVNGQDHVTEGDGGGAHPETDPGEESREPAAAGLEGVVAATQRRSARRRDQDADQ